MQCVDMKRSCRSEAIYSIIELLPNISFRTNSVPMKLHESRAITGLSSFIFIGVGTATVTLPRGVRMDQIWAFGMLSAFHCP
jgi:hypothetical protein